MKSPISDKINGGDIRIKKKKVIRSPLSEKYQRFLIKKMRHVSGCRSVCRRRRTRICKILA